MYFYTSLHNHSQMSLLDGSIRPEELVPHLREIGMNGFALTDHGSMAGTVVFYKALVKAGIQPILGVEAYCTWDPDFKEEKVKDNNHIVLLAKDPTGLKLLYKLTSEAYTNNFYYKPRIFFDKLECLAGHVVILTACLKGPISCLLEREIDGLGRVVSLYPRGKQIWAALNKLQKWFGDDLYLEMQCWDNNEYEQSAYNTYLQQLSGARDIKLVVSNDAHYISKKDYGLHELLMAMQLRMTLQEYKDGDIMRYSNDFYIKSTNEIYESGLKIGIPEQVLLEAMNNTIEVSNKCNVELELGKSHMPVYDITQEPDYQDFLKYYMAKNTSKTVQDLLKAIIDD